MKSISNYMSREQGRSVSGSQKVQIARWDKITAQIDTMRSQKDVLLKCGLVKEAKALQERINEAEANRRQLEDTINEERRQMAQAMLLCFASCDIATTCADIFAEQMHSLSHGYYKKENDFSKSIAEQAQSFNRLVQTIDEGEHEPLSLFYADMAEAITNKVIPIIQEIIKDYCNTSLGRRYF